jgi:chemotaxis protein MotB
MSAVADDTKSERKKLLCHACGTVSFVKVDKLPAHILEITCSQCGISIPLLDRMKEARSVTAGIAAEGLIVAPTGDAEQDSFYLRSHQEPEDPEEDSGWLMSFSDVMTQLLAFFILLTAMSSIDRHKFDQAMQSIGQALGGGSAKIAATGYNPSDHDLSRDWLGSLKARLKSEQGDMDQLRNTFKTLIAQSGLSNNIALHMDSEGLVVILTSAILFDEGSAEIRSEFKPVLYEIGLLLATLPNTIAIEGHTDNKPVSTQKYPSNWELSMQRAINVVKYYAEEQGLLNPARLIASGVASYRPRYNVNSEDGYRNRRVEIHIKRDHADLFEKIIHSR